VFLLAAVFCLFATVGLLALMMHPDRVSPAKAVLRIFLSGGFAVAYAGSAMARRFKFLIVVVALQATVETLIGKMSAPAASLVGQPEALQKQLGILGFAAMMGVILAYTLMIQFFKREGGRYFQVRTEMALASEIHQSLVPSYEGAIGGFEMYGRSVPTGDVGGDLVDVVERPNGWVGYVADVSGHGVQSGVLMAMFKTALRAQMPCESSPAKILDEVHRTLFPLKLGNMFVTVGILEANSGRVKYASAGHPSILHYHKRSGTLSELQALDLPLGIVRVQEFSERAVVCEEGDVLLVLTDGLTEVFDTKGNEMGVDSFKSKFAANACLPLAELFERLRKSATAFGPQTDDQTMLLVRFRGEEASLLEGASSQSYNMGHVSL